MAIAGNRFMQPRTFIDARAMPVARVPEPDPADILLVTQILDPQPDRDGKLPARRGLLQLMRSAIDTVHEMILVHESDSAGGSPRIVWANQAAKKVSGYEPHELVGLRPEIFNGPDTDMEAVARLRLSGVKGEGVRADIIQYRRGGEKYWAEVSTHAIRGKLDRPQYFVSIHRDITQRKDAENALRDSARRLMKSEETLAAAQDVAQVGSWDFDLRTREMTWSDSLYAIYGITRDQQSPTEGVLWNFEHPDDLAEVRAAYERAYREHCGVSAVHRIVLPNKKIKWVFERADIRYDVSGNPLREVGTVQDITEQKRSEERLAYLAHHDTLTGLANRSLLRDRLEQALARLSRVGRVAAVLFIDLDDFKKVNDTLGHAVGDQLLVEAAGRLRTCVRPDDTVARLGGDEFVVALTDVAKSDDVAAVCQRILSEFRNPIAAGDRDIVVNASIGVSIFPMDGENAESLLRNADAALYEAKRRGRDQFQFFTPKMHSAAMERLALETDLRHAVGRDELRLYYQPIVDVAAGRVVGAEGLVRWQHTSRGLVLPGQFIPMAENLGFVADIDAWVLRQAVQDLRGWLLEGGTGRYVAVNISGAHFDRLDLVANVLDALAAADLQPSALQLEVTESALMRDPHVASKALSELRQRGVRIAIDDFGTGYSSLAYLRRFTPDTLKIDRSFVADIEIDQFSRHIVQAIIGLASTLDVKIVAEGVETEGQRDALRELGCTLMQGFLFARPGPPSALY